jgi:hypothetical protein
MSKPATSLIVYAIYLGVGGAIVALFPHVMLNLLGLPQTNDVWIRFFGALAVALAAKGFNVARQNSIPSMQFDVYVRAGVATFIAVLVIMGIAPLITILLAVLEYLGAAWTQLAIWAERKHHHPATA